MAVGDTWKESDGLAVNVTLSYTVTKNQVARVEGFLGIAADDGESGDEIALDISQVERQLQVPSGLSVSKGDTIYIEVADLTGHTPDSTAYGTSSGAGKVAFMKATEDKDANHVVVGKMFPGGWVG